MFPSKSEQQSEARKHTWWERPQGHADLRAFRCGIVRRIAEQRAADELDAGLADALATIQRGVEGFYAAGASDVLMVLHEAVKIGKRVRR